MKMLVPVALVAVVFYSLGVSAVPTTAPSPTKRASKPLLQWTPPSTISELMPAFQAKIDWDLDNVSQHSSYWPSLAWLTNILQNHTIHTPSGLRASWWSREYV